MNSSSGGCPNCGSSDTVEQRVLEHCHCGCIQKRSAFTNGCPKCSHSEIEDEMRSVGTIRICNVCDNNWRPRADGGSVSTNRTGDHDSQIDLSKYRRRSTNQGRWLAGVRKRLGTQLTAAVILLLIVGVGLGGATLSTSLLADNTDDSLAPTDDQEWTEYETIAVFRNDDIQPWYKTNTRRAVDRVFI